MDDLIRLNNEIKQELVDEATQKAIYEEFKQINETSEALHVLKTIINFACTTSHNSGIPLFEFIKKRLHTKHNNWYNSEIKNYRIL